MSIHRAIVPTLRWQDGEIKRLILDCEAKTRTLKFDNGDQIVAEVAELRGQDDAGRPAWFESQWKMSPSVAATLAKVCPRLGRIELDVTRYGTDRDTYYEIRRIRAEDVDTAAGLPEVAHNRREPAEDKGGKVTAEPKRALTGW